MNTKIPRHMTMEIQVLACNVAGLDRLMRSQPSHLANEISNGNTISPWTKECWNCHRILYMYRPCCREIWLFVYTKKWSFVRVEPERNRNSGRRKPLYKKDHTLFKTKITHTFIYAVIYKYTIVYVWCEMILYIYTVLSNQTGTYTLSLVTEGQKK